MIRDKIYPTVNELTGKERRAAAEIVHGFLKDVLKEKDIADISPAAVLRDLYDCRVCVNHIAQVYLKGIMDPVEIRGLGADGDESLLIFDGRGILSKKEAEEIIKRVKDRGGEVK